MQASSPARYCAHRRIPRHRWPGWPQRATARRRTAPVPPREPGGGRSIEQARGRRAPQPCCLRKHEQRAQRRSRCRVGERREGRVPPRSSEASAGRKIHNAAVAAHNRQGAALPALIEPRPAAASASASCASVALAPRARRDSHPHQQGQQHHRAPQARPSASTAPNETGSPIDCSITRAIPFGRRSAWPCRRSTPSMRRRARARRSGRGPAPAGRSRRPPRPRSAS